MILQNKPYTSSYLRECVCVCVCVNVCTHITNIHTCILYRHVYCRLRVWPVRRGHLFMCARIVCARPGSRDRASVFLAGAVGRFAAASLLRAARFPTGSLSRKDFINRSRARARAPSSYYTI